MSLFWYDVLSKNLQRYLSKIRKYYIFTKFHETVCQTRVEDGEDEAFKLTISEEKDKGSY